MYTIKGDKGLKDFLIFFSMSSGPEFLGVVKRARKWRCEIYLSTEGVFEERRKCLDSGPT
jgi:hypothetical protein